MMHLRSVFPHTQIATIDARLVNAPDPMFLLPALQDVLPGCQWNQLRS